MKPKIPASLSLAIGIFCISLFPILVKWTSASSTAIAFYRMFFAFVLLIPIALYTQQFKLPAKNLLPYVIGSGLLFALDIAIWNESIKISNPTQSTVVGNLAPIWIGVTMFLFFSNKPRKEFWIGTLIAILGLFIFIGYETVIAFEFDQGFLLALLSSFLYATYMLVSKKALASLQVVQFMTYNMLSAAIFLAIICWVLDVPFGGYDTENWVVFLINALVCQLLGWLSINYAMKQLPAQRVSLSLLSQSIITGILAFFILKEEISIQMIIGGLIILSGIGYTFLPERSTPTRKTRKRKDSTLIQ